MFCRMIAGLGILGCVQKVIKSDNFYGASMPPLPNSRIGRMSSAPQEAFGHAGPYGSGTRER